jgi:hypothetical protein
LGTVLWISFYPAVIVGTCQKQKPEEDLVNKPAESSNQAMQRTAGRLKANLYMDPTLSLQIKLALTSGR